VTSAKGRSSSKQVERLGWKARSRVVGWYSSLRRVSHLSSGDVATGRLGPRDMGRVGQFLIPLDQFSKLQTSIVEAYFRVLVIHAFFLNLHRRLKKFLLRETSV
jgi:hypothetical protein